LLKLADLLIRPVEETPPTVKIHIPSTPIIEAAPQPLPVKAIVKAPRQVKTGGAPAKVPPATATTKLKLPGTPTVNSPRIPSIHVPPEPVKRGVSFAAPPAPTPSSQKANKAKPSKPASSSKPASTPKAQTAGMSVQDYKACKSALKKLKTNKHAALFLQPVDPIRDHAPKLVVDICQEGLTDLLYPVTLTSSRILWISVP
jgi:transcription initiation factor TFIID subunit 2